MFYNNNQILRKMQNDFFRMVLNFFNFRDDIASKVHTIRKYHILTKKKFAAFETISNLALGNL